MDYKIFQLLVAVVFLAHEVYSSSSSSAPPPGAVPPSSSAIPMAVPSNENGAPITPNNEAPQSNNGAIPSNNKPTQETSNTSPSPSNVPPTVRTTSTGNSQGPASLHNIPSLPSNNQASNAPSSNNGQTPPSVIPPTSSNNQAANNAPSVPSSSPTSTVENTENSAYLDLALIISQFQVSLYSAIVPTLKSITNVAISAFSVQTALALLYCGAGGETSVAMQSGLDLNSLATVEIVAEDFYYFLNGIQRNYRYGGAILEIANAIYIKEGYDVCKSYQALAKGKFFSQVETIDFKRKTTAAETINQYVSEKTNGSITDLVDASTITNDTVMMLVNTIYFQAYWHDRFFNSETLKSTTFHTSSKTTTTVDLMYQEGMFSYLYMTDFQVKVIKLNYYSSDMSMLIFLPDSYDGLSKLESDYETFNYTDIIKQMSDNYKVKLYLPKFTIDYEISLQEALTQLGMGIMFDKNNANFKGILEKQTTSGSTKIPQIYVSEVRHKVHIEVNEKGTVAAAATEIMMITPYSLRIYNQIEYAEFKADHPFMFILINNCKDVIFTGRYVGEN